MEQYIALLRGVNVGGKNTVSMALLKKIFEDMGLSDVKTYINSGNIIFSCIKTDERELQEKCQCAIEKELILAIPVAIILSKDLALALAHAPAWWDDSSESKHIAIFVIAPADAKTLVEQIGAIKPEYEKLAHYGQVIFWSAPIKTFSRTKWSKVIATTAYSNITIRNARTAKKLLQLTMGR